MVLERPESDFGFARPKLNFGKLPDWVQGLDASDFAARNAASILDWTRLAASAASLVCVLPVLTLSPIANRHSQMSGSAVAMTLNSIPL
jgi:hypothetical protein